MWKKTQQKLTRLIKDLSNDKDFHSGSDGEESGCNAGDTRGAGSIPGGGNGNPLQCSCLEDSMHRGAWRDTVHGVTKTWT